MGLSWLGWLVIVALAALGVLVLVEMRSTRTFEKELKDWSKEWGRDED